MLCGDGGKLPIPRSRRHRRRTVMQQLSLLEAPPPEGAAPVWNMLDEEQRTSLVTKLARLIARTIAHTPGEHDHERTE
jgi:hypothetical protein